MALIQSRAGDSSGSFITGATYADVYTVAGVGVVLADFAFMTDRIRTDTSRYIANSSYMTFVQSCTGDNRGSFITGATDTGVYAIAGVGVVLADFAFMSNRIGTNTA